MSFVERASTITFERNIKVARCVIKESQCTGLPTDRTMPKYMQVVNDLPETLEGLDNNVIWFGDRGARPPRRCVLDGHVHGQDYSPNVAS